MKKREKKKKKLRPFCTTLSPSLPLVSDGQLHGKAYWLWLQQEEEGGERARMVHGDQELAYSSKIHLWRA